MSRGLTVLAAHTGHGSDIPDWTITPTVTLLSGSQIYASYTAQTSAYMYYAVFGKG